MEKQKSFLEIYNIQTNERTILDTFDYRIEAPNWTPDGKTLIYNSNGLMYKYDLSTKKCEKIETGKCIHCNNDHVISADGKILCISAGTAEETSSRVWTLSIGGGEPVLQTILAPSYLHGISPDNKTLAYCAERGGSYDIYTIDIGSDKEIRLTDTQGLNDGSEYSPDGKYIWFNSVRSGNMHIWRMNADGSEQTQMTFDDGYNNWFGHISPDNQKVVFVSYYANDVKPGDHPQNKHVEIRMMDADGKNLISLLKTFGGQGAMNVNSWSPDSKKFAFVTYSEI